MSDKKKFRLVTRSDFDGLVCAILLKSIDLIDEIQFAHPKDVQDGTFPITQRDITTNLPYSPDCHMAFDHHLSEAIRLALDSPTNHVIDPTVASAARVVYDYYGGARTFPNVSDEMMTAVDKADSAQFTFEEILEPKGWVLMSYLMDARTGLGRFRDFRISNYQLMMKLIDFCAEHTVEEILELPDVRERLELYHAHTEKAREQIGRCSTAYGSLVVLDLRKEESIFATNRFTIYALHPECNISMHVMWGVKQKNTVFAIGNSILNRTSKVNIGELCLTYGGGGHANAGTLQVSNEQAESTRAELIARINAIGEGIELAPPLVMAGASAVED